MKKKVSGVYIIKCMGNSKIYVGSSNDIARRWSVHISLLRNDKHTNTEMQEDFNKFGWDKFSFRIKEECLQRELYEVESKYIQRYKPQQLYNRRRINNTSKKIRRGREAVNHREKWSIKNSGENNPNCTKFNVQMIKEIKTLIKNGVDLQEIADKYNTSKGYINQIKNGYKWSSVNIEEDKENE